MSFLTGLLVGIGGTVALVVVLYIVAFLGPWIWGNGER